MTIGFIGLGLMGWPMSRNLRRAGARILVFARNKAVLEGAAKEGMEICSSPQSLAKQVGSGFVILMLTNTAAVRQVVDGPDALIAALQPGAVIIDMGSSGVEDTKQWAGLSKVNGNYWLDAPVSGGQVGAIGANLTIMVGGERSVFERALPVFRVLGSTTTYVGPSGTGQATKLANQIIVAVTIAAVAEALTLARKAGAEPAIVRQCLLGGFAASRILELQGKRMIDGSFAPGGRASGQYKDVVEAVRLAQEHKLSLPMLEANLLLWKEMLNRGWGDLDHSALYKLYSDLTQ